MDIPFSDILRIPPKITREIDRSVGTVLRRGDFVLGKEVAAFERDFAVYIGAPYCVGVASGTDAMLLGLRALGIGKGDEVVVPALTFIATVSPILALGAVPVLVDVKEDTPLIDPSKVEKTVTKRTKAIICVHLHGFCCDMDALRQLATSRKLALIEDACQAHGSLYKGQKAGSFGTFAALSFYPAKNLGAYGDAGALVTSDERIDATVRMLRDHGQDKKYHHATLGYNSRLDTIQAAVLRVKLRYLDRFNALRCTHAKAYDRALAGLAIRVPVIPPSTVPNYHVYAIETERRDSLLQSLNRRNIHCIIHYPIPLHLQPALKGLGYKKGDFPNAEAHAHMTLSLPMFSYLRNREIANATETVRDFFRDKSGMAI